MSAEKFERKDISGSEFDDVALVNARFKNVNLADSTIVDCNLSQVAITECKTIGMTINGIPVDEALLAWRAAYPGGNLQDRH